MRSETKGLIHVPFPSRWDARAKIAAGFIGSGSKVLDLGCGSMALEKYLPARCKYWGCDLHLRSQETILCDFDLGEFPRTYAEKSDVIAALGVLEHLAQPKVFLSQLDGLTSLLLLSYHPKDFACHLDAYPKKAGKREFFLTEQEMVTALARAGFSLLHCIKLKGPQRLYLFFPSSVRPPIRLRFRIGVSRTKALFRADARILRTRFLC